jgi:hypothetical protein
VRKKRLRDQQVAEDNNRLDNLVLNVDNFLANGAFNEPGSPTPLMRA